MVTSTGKYVNIVLNSQRGCPMFGHRLASERKRLGLNQQEVGERLGIGRAAVGMIENGRATLDAERLATLESAGFDLLFVMTGQRGVVRASRSLDWTLCVAISRRVVEWSQRRGVTLLPEDEGIIVKHLYVQLAEIGEIDEKILEEALRIAA
jgi:transcriptional regulator with XRE-family HTH domain